MIPSSLRTAAAELPTLSMVFCNSSSDTLSAWVHFVRLVYVDLAAVRLLALGQAIHLFPPLEHGPALGWGLGDETVHRPNGRLALAPMFRSQLGSF
jgi:hypothetical protein